MSTRSRAQLEHNTWGEAAASMTVRTVGDYKHKAQHLCAPARVIAVARIRGFDAGASGTNNIARLFPKFRDRVCGGPATADREAPETSERARRKARSHGERPRVSSDGLARSLWHNRGRSGRTGPPVPHRRGFVTAVEEARNYGLGFAVAQAKLRARIRWNRSRFSLAIFNTQAPACRTSLPGR